MIPSDLGMAKSEASAKENDAPGLSHLLDVNTLVALGHTLHVHHVRAERWLNSVLPTADALATCAITELGFVRVSVQAGLQPDVSAARLALAKLKASSPVPFGLWSDELGADRLPKYVKRPAELTDGHLLELARAHGAQFVTLDGNIPGASLIPWTRCAFNKRPVAELANGSAKGKV